MIGITGIWTVEEAVHHQFSQELADKLIRIFSPYETVIDFGCGRGDYLKFFKENNFKDLIGIDGTLLDQSEFCKFLMFDLSNSLHLPEKGNVISLEVGEHIPEQYEQIFLNTITEHCSSILVLSWALPNQAGIGHVNCKEQSYIISEIEKRGFKFNEARTEFLKDANYVNTPWFKTTILTFDKL